MNRALDLDRLSPFAAMENMNMDTVSVPRVAIASCSGEQLEFEAWAKSDRYDMHEHPLHYLFLNEKTNAARQGWKAALEYVERVSTAPASPVVGEDARDEICGWKFNGFGPCTFQKGHAGVHGKRASIPTPTGPQIDYEYRVAVAYQIVGALLDRLDVFDTEKGQNILDYLNGGDVPDPLPLTWKSFGAALPTPTAGRADALERALTKCRDRFFPTDQPERDRDLMWDEVNSALSSAPTPAAQAQIPLVWRTPDINDPDERVNLLIFGLLLVGWVHTAFDGGYNAMFYNSQVVGSNLTFEEAKDLCERHVRKEFNISSSAPTHQAVTVDDALAEKMLVMSDAEIEGAATFIWENGVMPTIILARGMARNVIEAARASALAAAFPQRREE